MGKRLFARFALAACALLLVFIVGCESVGGRNLNAMIVKQLDVEKQEQSQYIEMEIGFNEKMLDEEDAKTAQMIKWFEKTSLEIIHSKIDGKGNMWVKGVLTFSKGSIPFTLHADSKAVRFDVEGVSRPLILDIRSMAASPVPGMMPAVVGTSSQDAFVKSVRQLVRNVAPYFVNALPNPPVIKVESAAETVNGVSTALTKVHAELNGEQLGDLISVYLDRLVQDKEGFRSMLRTVVQWWMELPPEVKGIFGEQPIDEKKDIDALVEEGMAQLWPELENAQKELKDAKQDEEWPKFFDKGITLTTDLYFDEELHMRKSAVELKIAPAAFGAEDSPVRQITVRTRGEMWNVNGEVSVPSIEIPVTALHVEEMDKMPSYKLLKLMDPNSVIYHILKDDLQVDDQSFALSSEWGIPFYQDKKGVAYVPIRSVMKEFGVPLAASRKGEIRFYDEATDQRFVFVIGSQKAFVNGKAVKLAYKVKVDHSITYIAASDLFLLLHAEYTVTNDTDGELWMKVTRDL